MGEQVQIRLSDEYQELLDAIQWPNKVKTRSDMIRRLIDIEALRLGMEPVVKPEQAPTS